MSVKIPKEVLTNKCTYDIFDTPGCDNMYKAYVFRMYPDEEQKDLINKSFGVSRFLYNHFLEEKQKEYKENVKSKSSYEQCKEIPSLLKEYPFLKEVDSCLIRNSIFNLDDSYKRFFNKLGGYPNFKKKGFKDSYKTNNIKSTYKGKTYNSIRLDLKNKIITLPKLKEVKIRGYRNKEIIIGNIKSATIKREAGRYYVSILVDEEIIKPLFNPKSIIGIDLGIKDLIITSHNEKIENSLEVKTINKRIKGLQKALSRSKVGSKNRYKIKLKIRRAFQKLKNKRKYLLHDITNKLVKNNDIIVSEDLDIKNMKENHYIAKRLTNIPLSEIIRMLKYKCERENKKFIQINRYYASSQICSTCGQKNNKLKNLSIREWKCEKCGLIHDRDINASLNIMFEGLKIYMKGLEQIA